MGEWKIQGILEHARHVCAKSASMEEKRWRLFKGKLFQAIIKDG